MSRKKPAPDLIRGGTDQVSNYSFGAAYFLLPRVIGTLAPVSQLP
jgi:hypothetical protein